MFFYFAIAALVYFFYKWGIANYDYFEKKGIAFSKPAFLFGSNTSLLINRKSFPETIELWYREFRNEK